MTSRQARTVLERNIPSAPPAPDYTGIIAMFNTTTLPTGWVLCDGSNGTPDLRDRFVVGAGSSYSLGAVGGANAVTLVEANLPNHSHNANADTNTSHNHGAPALSSTHSHSTSVTNTSHEHNYTGHGNYGAVANQFANYVASPSTQNNITSATTEAAHGAFSSGTSGHTHTASTGGTHNHFASMNFSGSSGSHENRPPYYALVFAQGTITAGAAVGMIAMTEGTVPTDWVACNATNAPDLRDRFVVGSQLSYTLGSVGGANTVTLTTTSMPQHNHGVGITTDNIGHSHSVNTSNHSHTVNALSAHASHVHIYGFQTANTLTIGGTSGTTIRTTPATGQITASAGSASHTVTFNSVDAGHSHSAPTGELDPGVHAHNVSGGTAGSGGAHENRPAYRATTFIRKTGALNEIPVGTILMFNGTIIPTGWVEATNYRDFFPVGAGLSYTNAAIGGANSVDISSTTMPQHNHNGATNSDGQHNHSLGFSEHFHSHSGTAVHNNHTHGSLQLAASNILRTAGTAINTMLTSTTRTTTVAPAGNNAAHTHTVNASDNNNSQHTHSMVAGGAHSHSANTGSAGSGVAHENRPPYYALTFIIKT